MNFSDGMSYRFLICVPILTVQHTHRESLTNPIPMRSIMFLLSITHKTPKVYSFTPDAREKCNEEFIKWDNRAKIASGRDFSLW